MSKDTVIVLKSVNYSESDKVLTVFGRYLGKFTLFARGIRKINSKNRGNVQTLNTCEISFFEGKGLPVLGETALVYCVDTDILKNRVEDIKRVLILLNKILQEYDPNEKVFRILQEVCKKSFDIESVNRFRVIFLKEMGFLNDFSVCNICGTVENIEYLDLESFALLCKNCYSKSGNSYRLGKNPYVKNSFTQVLDIYVKRIVEEI
jgi:DNA repair protein RecO (recombination protein O)